jgi:hypothetical protein
MRRPAAQQATFTFWIDRKVLAEFRAFAELELGRKPVRGYIAPASEIMRRLVKEYVAAKTCERDEASPSVALPSSSRTG